MNLKEVTKKEFFEALYKDPRDIMPKIVSAWSDEFGFIQNWLVVRDETLFGQSKGNPEIKFYLNQ